MKQLFLIVTLLSFGIIFYAQMVRENPVAGCKITQEYGMETVTYYLTGSVHIAKKGEFVDLYIYVVKDGPADLVIKFVDFNPRFCGEWQLTKNEGIAIQFVDSEEDATFTVRFGDPEKEYGFHSLPA